MSANNEMPVSPPRPSGRVRSGKARMQRLSGEERKDLARLAAEKRWSTSRSTDPSVLIYQSDDRKTRIDVRIEGDTVWLSQAQMADLFQTTKQNVSTHVRNISNT